MKRSQNFLKHAFNGDGINRLKSLRMYYGGPIYASPLLDMLAINYYYSDREFSYVPEQLSPYYKTKQLYIYKNNKAWPYFYLAEGIEEKKQGELNEIHRLLLGRRDEIETLRSKQTSECETAAEGTSTVDAMAYRQLVGEWIEWANEDIERIEREIVLLNFEAERRREALAEAAKATMTLEKLKEKEETEYREQ